MMDAFDYNLLYVSYTPGRSTKRVPVLVNGKQMPGLSVMIVKEWNMIMWQLDVEDACAVICACEATLKATGAMAHFQRVGYPFVRDTRVEYSIFEKDEALPIRRMLKEIPVGRQRIVEKRALSCIGRLKDIPEALVDLLCEFVWPVDHRMTH